MREPYQGTTPTTAGVRRLLFLTKYGRRAASTRFRFQQYFPFLEAAGFACDVSPLLDDRYLDAALDERRTDLGAVVGGYARRMRELARVRQYDAVVLHHEALPYLPGFYERWLQRLEVPYVYDFDDATFHKYNLHPRRLVRAVLGRKFEGVIAGAALVMAGNEYLAEYASRFSRRVEIVPTVVDTALFAPAGDRQDGREVVVGWIGSPSTSVYLHPLAEAWRKAIEPGRARLVLVGSGPVDLGPLPVTVVPWREETEVSEILKFDIGIMPLVDDPWSRGKCGFKLIEYMACGLPVVASPVGVNSRIVEQGAAGFLCATSDEWVTALRTLIDDPDRRKRLGAQARAAAVTDWSLEQWAPRVVRHLQEVVAVRATR